MGVKGRGVKDGSSGIWQDHTIAGLGDILSYEAMRWWELASGGKHSPQAGVEDRTQFGNCSVSSFDKPAGHKESAK